MTVGPVVVASRYRLGQSLGEGGMGKVWMAHDEVLDRHVAIKEIVLPDNLVDSEREALHERTLREARAAARLSHPNTVQVFDVIEADGRTWIVMEYVHSRSLGEVVKADGPLPPRRVAEIGLAVLAALDAAHSAGVHHRDVKPANVLLVPGGRVVLTDFGIATIEGDGIITSSDMVFGSPQYMSPERIRDGTTVAASDLWSLGATLYTAVEGHSPYERASAMETLTAVAADEPDPPRRAGVLGPVLAGLLRKDPAARIDAGQTRRMLEQAVAGVTPQPRGRRRLVVAAAAVTAVLLGGTAATVVALRPDRDTEARGTPVTSQAAPSAVPSPSAPAVTPAPSVSPTSAGKAGTAEDLPARPAGWRDYRDPTGFRVYVPSGWKKSKEGSIVYFRGDGQVLGIDQTDTPRPNPSADWRGQASYRVGRGDFPDYDEVRIKSVPYFRKAADWEFTFDRGGRQHVNNRGFVTSKRQAYGIYWQTPDSRWKSTRDDLQLVFDSFRPAAD